MQVPDYTSGGAFRGDRANTTVDKYVRTDTLAYRPDFAGDNRDQRSFLAWASLWLNAARVASVPGAVLCSFIDWRQLPILTDAARRAIHKALSDFAAKHPEAPWDTSDEETAAA